MASREGLNRTRPRPTAPLTDQVYTRLGRTAPTLAPVSSTPVSTTVVQNSGNVHLTRVTNNKTNPINNVEKSSSVEMTNADPSSATISTSNFDAEQFRSEIKAKGHDEKSLEKLVLNAINYFLTTSKRFSQQVADYTVLTFLAWTVTVHGEVFRLPPVTKAMCNILRNTSFAKSMQTALPMNNGNNLTLPTTPYTLVCQILWLAFKVRRRRIFGVDGFFDRDWSLSSLGSDAVARGVH